MCGRRIRLVHIDGAAGAGVALQGGAMPPADAPRPFAPARSPAPLAPVLAALLVLVACGPGGDAPPAGGGDGVDTPAAAAEPEGGASAPDTGRTSAADRFVTEGLDPVGRTRAEIRATLGEPDSVRHEPVANRHIADRTDTIVTLHYPTLRATVYAVTGGNDLLQSVRVTDDRHLRDPAIRIGMPWEEVRRRLGEPHDREGDVPVYWCRRCTGAEHPVRFHVVDGRVRAVEFTYYVD